MGESLRIILLLIPLIAGAIAVFFSFQLMKRFQDPFVHSYFYYLVFLYIFGVYSLAGSGILQHALTRMEVEQEVIHSARFYTLLIGIPFFILANFMLFRSLWEFRSKKLPVPFTIAYFISALILFVLYGILIIRLNRFQLGEFQQLITLQRWAFMACMFLIYLSAFLSVLMVSKRIVDVAERRFIRLFIAWYLFYMIFTIISYSLISLHPIVPFIFLFLFLSWHLVPILFLNIFLENHHGKASSMNEGFESRLSAIVEEYDISKREREVIQLICKGLTNQEIGDSLFISLQTVKDHIHRIFLKTGVKNRVQLTNLIRSK